MEVQDKYGFGRSNLKIEFEDYSNSDTIYGFVLSDYNAVQTILKVDKIFTSSNMEFSEISLRNKEYKIEIIYKNNLENTNKFLFQMLYNNKVKKCDYGKLNPLF